MSATLNTTTERLDDGTAVLTLGGELDASNFQSLIEVGRDLHLAGARRLIIDLSDLSYMASSGLVALYSIALLMRGDRPPDPEAGWAAFHAIGADEDAGTQKLVKLLSPQAPVARVLERTGLTRFFDVYPDRSAAIASF